MKSDIKSSSHLFGEQERAKVLCNANGDFLKLTFLYIKTPSSVKHTVVTLSVVCFRKGI